jgi:hypothetical protein
MFIKYFLTSFLFILLIESCMTLKNCSITITGKAENKKSGAIVRDSLGNGYFIDGLSGWSNFYLNRDVKVNGVLKIKEYDYSKKKKENDTLQTQKIDYDKGVLIERIILKAKYELVK